MKNKLIKMLNVKSILTLTMAVLVYFLAIRGSIKADYVEEMFKAMVFFYIGRQAVPEVKE